MGLSIGGSLGIDGGAFVPGSDWREKILQDQREQAAPPPVAPPTPTPVQRPVAQHPAFGGGYNPFGMGQAAELQRTGFKPFEAPYPQQAAPELITTDYNPDWAPAAPQPTMPEQAAPQQDGGMFGGRSGSGGGDGMFGGMLGGSGVLGGLGFGGLFGGGMFGGGGMGGLGGKLIGGGLF